MLAEQLTELRAHRTDFDRRIEETKQRLIQKLGCAEVGLMPGASGTLTYKETTRAGFVKVYGLTKSIVEEAFERYLPEEYGTPRVEEQRESTYRVLRQKRLE